MKKKKVIIFLCLFCLLFSAGLFSACSTDKKTATLTIDEITKEYDGESVNVEYETNSNGAVSIVYKSQTENDINYTETAPINAGNYVVKISIAETDEYKSISATKNFTISKATPIEGTDYVIPTGLAIISGQKLSTIDLSESNLSWTNGDTIITQAGTYYATFTPTDTQNYKTITNVAIEITIVSNLITIPTLDKQFTYDGTQKSVTTSDIQNLNSELIEIISTDSVFSGTNANAYEIILSIKNNNYAWSDNTTENKTLYWHINPIKVTEPIVTNTNFTFSGTAKEPTVNYNNTYIDLSGTSSAINTGTYTLTFTLKDSTGNYVWTSDNSYVPLSFTWKINAITVELPTISNTDLTYTGSALSPTTNYDNDYIELSNDSTTSATEKGNYSITFILKDTSNYVWADKTTQSKTYTWKISSVKIDIPILNKSFGFDEEEHTITTSDITNFDNSKMEIVSDSSTLTATSAGTYNIVIALLDSSNYSWSDGSTDNKTLTWTIVDNTYSFSFTCDDGTSNCYTVTRNSTTNEYTVTFKNISEKTTYIMTGSLDGNIVIDVGEDYEFDLVLNGATIQSSYNSPIFANSADKFTLKAEGGSTNTITDNRPVLDSDSSQKSAAIYSAVDLSLTGKGNLTVVSVNNNGIHTKDDLSIKNQTLSVTCIDNALKGNDEVEIKSGTITLTSKNGDAIKTSNSESSSQGNQKGSVIITGGTVTIYSASDGIDAAFNTEISGDETVVKIYTTSEYAGSNVSSLSSVISGTYYIMASSSYNYTYSIRYKTSTGYTMVNADTEASKTYSSYKYFAVDTVANATSFEIYAYSSPQTQGSFSTYYSKSSSIKPNKKYDTLKITSLSSSSISASWTLYETSSSENSDKLAYSAKGIKANNAVIINSGEITVYAYDDAIHANSDEIIESTSSYGSGGVTLSGGTIETKSHDDAVHADGTLTINGATLTVLEAYEGIEGNIISIESGTATITASDDGVNAQSQINVSGGRLDVTVPSSGDTDGIDSNGTITISGGIVITRGPNDQNMCPLDADSSISITGGTVIIVGYSASKTSSSSRNQFPGQFGGGGGMSSKISTSLTQTQSSSAGLSIGGHTVTIDSTTISYINAYTYSGYTTVYASSNATII